MSKGFITAVLNQVAPYFDEATLRAGIRCAEQKRVHLVKDDCWPVVARISEKEGYVVTVTQKGDALFGECSCPNRVDCEHAAATALLAVQRQLERLPNRDLARKQAQVSEWLVTLNPNMAELTSSQLAQQPSRYVVLYILREDAGSIGLTVARAAITKRGDYTNPAVLPVVKQNALPSWVPAEDIRFVALLRAACPSSEGNYLFATERLSNDMWRDLAATGRLFWESAENPPLQYGSPLVRPLTWVDHPNRDDEFLVGIDDDIRIVRAAEYHYVDTDSFTIGKLDVGVSSNLANALLSGPAVHRSMLRTAQRSLETLVASTPCAETLGPITDGSEPTLELRAQVFLDRASETGYYIEATAAYDGRRFPLAKWGEDEGPVIRDLASEGRELSRLHALTENASASRKGAQSAKQLDSLRSLAHEILPTLAAHGWVTDLPADFPFEQAISPNEWTETLRPSTGEKGWFAFELGVRVGDQIVSLLPLLLEVITRDSNTPEALARDLASADYTGLNLTLPDGRLVHIPASRVARWVRPLVELRLRGLNQDGELCVPAHTAVDLEKSEIGRFESSDARDLAKQQLAALISLPPSTEGKDFDGVLRTYQRQGLGWIRFMHDAGFGGVLADDLGLGKTVQLLAFIDGLRADHRLPKKNPTLVVVPRSVVNQWRSEATRFVPKLDCLIHLGADREKTKLALKKNHVVFTSYQTLFRDIDLFSSISWTTVIFDESQAIKNPDTKLRRAVSRLESKSRFCVTGTPVENHLTELWSQIDLAMPGILGSRRVFDASIRSPIEKHGAEVPLNFLRKRIRPFILRRTKDVVALELPEKTETIERVVLGSEQRDLYESLRLELDKSVRKALGKSKKGSSFAILDALLKLRQCCCDPRLVKLASAREIKSSAKLERLMSMLHEIAESGRAVLVFSQFTSMLELIETECIAAGIKTLKLTGATKHRDRVVNGFQNGAAPVFLISLKAGGVGLNLTRADTVIHYDPWWNPATETQATDRAHRIGQTKCVFVYRLVAEGTVEDKLIDLKRKKRKRADEVLAGTNALEVVDSDLESLYRSLS